MIEKRCPRCKLILLIDNFTKNPKRKDGLQAYCIECMRKYRLEHYYKNKQQYYDRNTKTNNKLRDLRDFLKLNAKCNICGIEYPNEPYLFEFDQIIRKEIYDNLGTTIEPLAGAVEKTLTHIGLYTVGGAAIGLILGILTVRFSRRGR